MSADQEHDRSRGDRLAARIDLAVHRFARHWLLLCNVLVALYVALTLAAPLLMHLGHTGAGRLIYLAFRPQCHQLPERSLFLFGEKSSYTLEELVAADVLPGLSLRERAAFLGSERQGYKVAFCQRDLATWSAILMGGLLFGASGRRWRTLPIWGWALLLLPAAVDGGTQLLGLRESTLWMRTITGGLFGMGTVWLAYPHVHRAMSELQRESQARRR
jgi:uncharacterized membrane protein